MMFWFNGLSYIEKIILNWSLLRVHQTGKTFNFLDSNASVKSSNDDSNIG